MSLAEYFESISPATDNFLTSDEYDNILSNLDVSAMISDQQNDVAKPNIISNVLLNPVECRNLTAEIPAVGKAIKISGEMAKKTNGGRNRCKAPVKKPQRSLCKTPIKKPRRNPGKILKNYLSNHTAVSNDESKILEIDLTNQSSPQATDQDIPLFTIEEERLLLNVSALRKELNGSYKKTSDNISELRSEIKTKNIQLCELLIKESRIKNKIEKIESYFSN